MKECICCHVEKPFTDYHKDKYTLSGLKNTCKSCVMSRRDKSAESKQKKEYYEQNKATILARTSRWHKENRKRKNQTSLEYYREHKVALLAKGKIYKLSNKAKLSAARRKRETERFKTDLVFRLNSKFGLAIRKALKTKKCGRSWKKVLGYTAKDLKEHLEKRFLPGMTWDNYGTLWHIDHKRPKSWFKYSSILDKEFFDCWSLSNLQPLFAIDNMRKHNRFHST